MKVKALKNGFKIFVASMVLTTLLSCNNNSYKEAVNVESVDINEEFEVMADDKFMKLDLIPEISNRTQMPKDLKIIKSASARYKVKNVKEATNAIKRMVNGYEAYISDLRFQNNLHIKENRFTIKVPNKFFDKVMDSINTVAEFVEYENITTKDVTEEYVDLQARLKTKLEVKERYESILRKNAKTVEDILVTEDKLRIIQEEIESAQGRLKYLTNKVSFSTIQIDLYESVDYKKEPVAYNKTFWTKMKSSLANGLYAIEVVFLGVMNIWPILLVGTVLFLFVKNRLRK